MMNVNLKNYIRDFVDITGNIAGKLLKTLNSCLRMFVLSSPISAYQTKSIANQKVNKKCTILANGPSLKTAMDNNEVILSDVDVFCVNSFCESEYFWTIKPKFYFLVDGQFFNPTLERCKSQVNNIQKAFSEVDWDMVLFISTSSGNGGVLTDLTNPKIKVIRLNTTTVEGYKWFRHSMYRIRMGMPRCQTVVNMAISTSVIMGYNEVFLYGADHSWTKDLRVDDDNICCYGDRHVYNTGLVVIKKDKTIGELLLNFSRMFDSHWIINEYAMSKNIHIWNCTRGSFVDAYERFKYNN